MDQVAGRGRESGKKGRSNFCHLSHEETGGGLECQRQRARREGTGGGPGETRMERAGNQDSRVISEEGRYRVKDEKWVLRGITVSDQSGVENGRPALNESAAFISLWLMLIPDYLAENP